MTIAIDENNFIYEIKKGNEDGLYYVIDKYGYILKSVTNKHLFYLEDHKEECINDCLLAVWENIDSFNPNKSEFKNWIAGIAKYKSIDYIRKYLKDKDIKNIEDENLNTDKDNLDILLEKEFEEGIEDLLLNLSEKDRKIFRETYFYEKTAREVSEELNIKEANVYNRLSRGREKLKLLLGGKDNE